MKKKNYLPSKLNEKSYFGVDFNHDITCYMYISKQNKNLRVILQKVHPEVDLKFPKITFNIHFCVW